jgi:hypothetical protein
MDMSRIINDKAVEFVSAFDNTFYTLVRTNLASFIENGFLKELFEKDSSVAVDKTQLLTKMFGDATDPVNFTLQAQAMNIQLIQLLTLSLLYSMALYISSRSWDNFLAILAFLICLMMILMHHIQMSLIKMKMRIFQEYKHQLLCLQYCPIRK